MEAEYCPDIFLVRQFHSFQKFYGKTGQSLGLKPWTRLQQIDFGTYGSFSLFRSRDCCCHWEYWGTPDMVWGALGMHSLELPKCQQSKTAQVAIPEGAESPRGRQSSAQHFPWEERPCKARTARGQGWSGGAPRLLLSQPLNATPLGPQSWAGAPAQQEQLCLSKSLMENEWNSSELMLQYCSEGKSQEQIKMSERYPD